MKKRLSALLIMLCLMLSGCGGEVIKGGIDSGSSFNYEENAKETSQAEQAEANLQSEQAEQEEENQQNEENLQSKVETDAQTTDNDTENNKNSATSKKSSKKIASASVIPPYTDEPYVIVNDNVPQFAQSELTTTSFEQYSELDSLGRCGVAYACIGKDLMPTEKRESISKVKPSGWQSVKYNCVEGRYLYNRCHLIGYQLSGENINPQNLITGTRYLNIDGMLSFENMVADYVEDTGNHVMYRVTPVYEGDNLVASGVQMEAQSVEDNGEGISFNVYCYNVQPGVTIDYANGDSKLDDTVQTASATATKKKQKTKKTNKATTEQNEPVTEEAKSETVYITDTGSKYHSAGCRYLKSSHEISLDEAEARGYEPCSVCR